MNEYVAVLTKIRAIQNRFIDKDTYLALMHSPDVAHVCEILRTSAAYTDTFASMNLHTNHRRTLELVLRRSLYGETGKIMSFLPEDSRDVVRVFLAKYELADLKRLFRLLHNRSAAQLNEIASAPVSADDFPALGLYTHIDREEAVYCSDIAELKRLYQHTPFFRFFPDLRLETNNAMFYYEMALDKGLYALFEEQTKKLSGKDKAICEEILGGYCDMLNLQWIYRATTFYHVASEVIFNYTLDMHRSLHQSQLRRMCYAGGEAEVAQAIKQTKYHFLIKENETTNIFMERRIERYVFYSVKRLIKHNPMSIAGVLGHVLLLLHFQLRDVICIIEAKKYHLSDEETFPYLIRSFEREA